MDTRELYDILVQNPAWIDGHIAWQPEDHSFSSSWPHANIDGIEGAVCNIGWAAHEVLERSMSSLLQKGLSTDTLIEDLHEKTGIPIRTLRLVVYINDSCENDEALNNAALYALLVEKNETEMHNLMASEEPVEYGEDGLNKIQSFFDDMEWEYTS